MQDSQLGFCSCCFELYKSQVSETLSFGADTTLCPQQFNLDLIKRLEQHLEWSGSTVLCINSYLVPPKDWQIHRGFHNPNASFRLFHHTICPQRTYSKSKQSLNVEPDKHYLNEKVFKETRLPPTHSPFGGPKFG